MDERYDYQQQLEEQQRRQEEEREWLKKWRDAWEAWARNSTNAKELKEGKTV